MSYPGDPAGGQQQPAQYPYSGSPGYPPPQPGGGGFNVPPPPPPMSSPYAPGAAPVPTGYEPAPAPGYGGGYGGYDPNMPPVSGPPISGSPYPGSMSGPPSSGPPVLGPMPTTAMSPPAMLGPADPSLAGRPPRRGPATAIFASLMVLFLLSTAVLAVLFITRNSAYNDEKRTVAARDKTIQGLNGDVQKLNGDVKQVTDERDAAKRDLGGAQGQADELKRQKGVISHCLTLLGESSKAATNGDKATSDAKFKEAGPVCDEAFRYLD